ncbi:MAG: hypothetical protein JWR72_4012 [Flavisolibacter sp.]|jgi:ABC-2 type transport system permease protein|nr:hypothetical protein [Flavisolibacter sp.]
MLHLLKIEWLKLKNYRTFWILFILFLISLFGINYITFLVQSNRPQDPMSTALIGAPFQFPEVWHTVTYMSGFLLFIPGVLMIITISNEFAFKTHRQNVIDGQSRTQFIITKMMLATIFAVISTIVVFITALLFGLFEKDSVFSTTGITYILYFFIQAVSYMMVSLLFGLFFRRSGIAIGVYFLYIFLLENLIAGLLDKYANHIGAYLPLKSTNSLIPFPFFRNITSQFYYEPNFTILLVLSAVYLTAYIIVGKRKFETVDL